MGALKLITLLTNLSGRGGGVFSYVEQFVIDVGCRTVPADV